MATIKRHFDMGAAQLPATNYPEFRKEVGTSYPYGVYYFDPSTDQAIFFKFKISNYGSGNPNLNIVWVGTGAVVSGDVVFSCAIGAITPDVDTSSISTKALASAQTVTDSHLGTTADREMKTTIAVSNLDSVAADDFVILKFSRAASNGSDNYSVICGLVDLELTWSDQ